MKRKRYNWLDSVAVISGLIDRLEFIGAEYRNLTNSFESLSSISVTYFAAHDEYRDLSILYENEIRHIQRRLREYLYSDEYLRDYIEHYYMPGISDIIRVQPSAFKYMFFNSL
jgi:hypothetical protein